MILNQAQNNFYKNYRTFSNSIFNHQLGSSIQSETDDYKYSIHATENVAFSYGIPKKPSLRRQVGAVFVVPVSKNHPEVVKGILPTASIFYAADLPGVTKLPDPFLQEGIPTCSKGTQIVQN
ncbi:type IV pilin-like G/H family protein [Tumidithrix elongata RA019]|uniref:Type IV pilin-like G/H family protein n=1 Tax=Tumidithrix elongata BACA0141 TaxID=2716417 RepID=A0AAW9PXD3_9CYAN|nr:type IV pilin-like G/H family protein [Tumidithrix elongata RA019]